eukprot:scaffold181720_cov21-Prasinocladus_malaysianus.AAC.1
MSDSIKVHYTPIEHIVGVIKQRMQTLPACSKHNKGLKDCKTVGWTDLVDNCTSSVALSCRLSQIQIALFSVSVPSSFGYRYG